MSILLEHIAREANEYFQSNSTIVNHNTCLQKNTRTTKKEPILTLMYGLFGVTILLCVLNAILRSKEGKKFWNSAITHHLQMKHSKTNWALSVLTALIILPIAFVILVIGRIYRSCVYKILLHKHNTKFGGLLDGPDTVWAIEYASRSIINAIMIIEVDTSFSGDLFDIVKKEIYLKIFMYPERFLKLLATYRKSMGYYYLLKNQVQINDCVKQMPIIANARNEIDKNDLQNFVSLCSNDPLPKNHTAFWEVFIGTQHLVWSKTSLETPKKQFPILFRLHHSLGDGLSILKLLVGVFAETPAIKITSHISIHYLPKKESYQNNQANVENISKAQRKIDDYYITIVDDSEFIPEFNKTILKVIMQELVKWLSNTCNTVYNYIRRLIPNIKVLLLIPSSIIMRRQDVNILHGPALTGRKILVWHVEETPCYIQVINRIKNRIPHVKFSDVLLTAISGTFWEYYKKNSLNSPEYITAVIPALLPSQRGDINNKDKNFRDLRNNFSVGLLNLPISVHTDNERYKFTLINRLMKVKRQADCLRNSIDYKMNYWLLSTVCTILPESILKHLFESDHSTLAVSNLPGPREIKVFQGKHLKDIVFWIPHRGNTGIGVSILSYDGRLQIGLSVDEALISSADVAQSIINGIYTQLAFLEAELDYGLEKHENNEL